MSEKFCTTVASVATGSDKTAINIFHAAAAPTSRGKIYEVVIGGVGTLGDNSADFYMARTTAVGTEGSGLVPNNLDPAGPAGEMDSGLGVFGGEPTYTAAKQLLRIPLYHRNTARWLANGGCELMMTATQNNGAGLKTVTSGSTQAYGSTIYFTE